MSEHEEEILINALIVLRKADASLAEAVIQGGVQTKMGTYITVDEMQATLRKLNEDGLVSGLPGPLGKLRYMITPEGKHLLAQLKR